MYKILNIGGKDYKFEFSIEASLYNDCIEKITELMINIDSRDENQDIKSMVASVSDIPSTAISCFYAGLLEHHGAEGDRSVLDKKDAKALIRVMFADQDGDIHNWYDVLDLCASQMREDGFFELIGLTGASRKRQPKVPQDHKKKQTKKITEVSGN